MANRFCEPFSNYADVPAEVYNSTWLDPAGNLVSVITPGGSVYLDQTGGRFGIGCCRVGGSSNTQILELYFASGFASGVFGSVFNMAQPTNTVPWLRFKEGSTEHFDLRQNSSGNITLTNNGTLRATGSAVVSVGDHTLEVVFTCADAGSCKVYLDGSLDIDFSGDIRNGGTPLINRILMCGNNALVSSISFIEQSEIYVNDTTGSAPNNARWTSWRIEEVLPTADGGVTGMTPLSSTNVSNVDEANHDSETSYNTADAVNEIDTFQMGSVTPAGGTVAVVGTRIVARSLDAGVSTIAPVIRQSSTNYVGSNRYLTNTYRHMVELEEINPATSSAFTISEMRSTSPETGVKRTT